LLVSPLGVALAWFGKRRGLVPAADFGKILTLAVLCLILLLLLVRGNLDSRLGDVAGPCFVLLACTMTLSIRWSRQRRGWARGDALAGVLVVATLTWGSLGVVSPDGPAPSDRVLVMGYHPQVFFYAERPFAAGMVVSYSSYFTDPASQRHAVSRLRQESVLIVITDSPRRLQDQYALIGAYVAGRFTLVAKSGFGDSESYEVLVDRSRRSVRTVRVADVSLPCFVPRQAGGEAF